MIWIYDHWRQALPLTIDWAVRDGNVRALEWMLEETTLIPSSSSLVEAVKGGHFEILRLLHEKRPRLLDNNVVAEAVRHNQLEIVKYFGPLFEPIKKEAIDLTCSCTTGGLPMLKWVFEHYKHLPSAKEITEAIKYRNIDIVEWILGIKDSVFTVQRYHINHAIYTGNHLLYQLLVSHRKEKYIITTEELTATFERGDVCMLKVLLEHSNDIPDFHHIEIGGPSYSTRKWLADTGRWKC